MGLAFAHKYKGDGGVAMTLYGDGAANQGQLYEAMCAAARNHVPPKAEALLTRAACSLASSKPVAL